MSVAAASQSMSPVTLPFVLLGATVVDNHISGYGHLSYRDRLPWVGTRSISWFSVSWFSGCCHRAICCASAGPVSSQVPGRTQPACWPAARPPGLQCRVYRALSSDRVGRASGVWSFQQPSKAKALKYKGGSSWYFPLHTCRRSSPVSLPLFLGPVALSFRSHHCPLAI